ncbi:MAG TPA: S8/S53 family peptidase [Ignavibacteriaceae bacterium]|nr:S8/S53 family peptidase [Ignavibacteriaceae bacterium]
MKTLNCLFALFTLMLTPSTIISGDYFYAGDQKVSINIDRSTMVVIFKQDKLFKNSASFYESIIELNEATVSIDQKMVMLVFRTEQLKTEIEILTDIGLSIEDIEWYSFGYIANNITPLRPTNRISFKLRTGYSRNDLEPFIKGKATFDSTPFGTPQIKINEPKDDIVLLSNKIYKSGFVEYCHPDFIADIILYDDPLYSQQYFLNHTQQFGGNKFDTDIDAPEAWDITKGSSTITVAVIDDGLDAHDDLKDANGNNRIVGGYTPYNGGNGSPSSDSYHGIPCAGIIAASHNNINVKGVAPNVKLVTVNILSPLSSNDQVADGINWAWKPDKGKADILSNSWGYGCNASGFTWPAITTAITNARTQGRGGKGCIVVFAAGNNYPTDKCGYGPAGYISFPATVTGVLCVSASNYNGNIASYSSRGNRIDVTALGGESDIRTLDRMGSYGYNTGNDVTNFDGTSAACPQLAGVAALILSVNPNLTEQQVRDIITSNATDMGTVGKDNLFGWGRVNAAKSVAKAYSLANPNYYYTIDTAPLNFYDSNFNMTFTSGPIPGVLAAGAYTVDRYYIDVTRGNFISTPQAWYTAPYGYSWASPNNASRWLFKETTSSSVRFKTVFYFIKTCYPPCGQINLWAPFDPNTALSREFITLGIPPIPPVIDHFVQNPNPICKGGSGSVTAYLSQGNPTPTYTWTKIDGPASFYILNSTGNPCYVAYNYTGLLSPDDVTDAVIQCTATINGVGSNTKNYIVELVNECPSCPTLAFDVGGEMKDDNPLLITSLSNPGVDVTDYYLIQNSVTPVGNKINLRIHEPQTEHTWLDYVELIEAKVKSDELVAMNDEGEVINYKNNTAPVTVLLNGTTDITEILSSMDTLDIDLNEGDIITIQRNIQAPENDGDGDLVLGGIDPIKDQESITLSLTNKEDIEGENSKLGDLTFFFRPNKSIIAKKLRNLPPGNLEITINRELTLNYLTIVRNIKTARVNSLGLLSANHQHSGDVKNLLLGIDQNYAEIFPGDMINFVFQKGTIPAEKIEYILKSVGRYETDTTSALNKLAGTGEENLIPKENKLYDNYPNPFNPITQIKYSVKENGLVTLKVYDILGKEVAALVNEEKQAGTYTVTFDAGSMASGIYFYTISANDYQKTKKMILIK